jgi:predicted nucleic acid-binding protein
VKRLGIDTAPFIYFVEANPRYVDLCRQFFRLIDGGDPAGFTSVLTLAEVLSHPLRVGDAGLEAAYRGLLLETGGNLSVVPITAEVAARAAGLRARHNLKTPDALQVASALEAGCEAFLTNDHGLGRVSELRVLVLDDLLRPDVEDTPGAAAGDAST